jgi:signal transduction histidine kinase
VAPATRHRRGVTTGAPANARVERERALVAREEAVARRERALARQAETGRASQPQAQPPADTERLMDQMREANERLLVAAVQAQNLSDETHTEARQARDAVHHLLNQLQSANERLAAGAAYAHAMAEEARAHEEEYRRLSSRLLVVQDEERRRLALDLHDPIGQRLAALAMHLDVIGQRAKALDAGSRRALAESRSLADQCAREVRTFAYLLHPPMLDEMGLRSAVRWYAEGFTKRSGIQVVVDLADVGRLSRPIETALFRVVQESLTNVHRHASTATASIRLTVRAGVVALEIHDQGHGRRDRPAHQTGTLQPETLGVGIQGMRERIRQLGGTFDIEFADKGTTVCVRVPNEDVP